jgi:hypothetical protein
MNKRTQVSEHWTSEQKQRLQQLTADVNKYFRMQETPPPVVEEPVPWIAPLYYEDRQAYFAALDNYMECCPNPEINPYVDPRETWHRETCPKRSYRQCMWCKEFRHPGVLTCPCNACFP